ncbi:helix-turn-helix transcriptional regulator [Xenorhabdus sp. XENO-10]|uniref:Helix-turn-helix transcriptional regulator n=1 Tax=Xenorhabdus yunnanensis TaxID=3025878 RepID=A0ABT5LP97_9GAMM|nr:helix-turn-helix transcriptional regulator [Xenorhabdus yunnanensis]MDC9591585.1 helix-turn-helix transcriptional regulator [Xenorhabdus yunnanensis]
MNAHRLVAARKACGLSQRTLGEALGINPEQAIGRISRYERGVATPAYEIVCQIAEILNVPSCYFYIEDDNFAEQVLILHKMNSIDGFENNLIVYLQEEVQEYKNALKEMQKIMNSLKNL